MPGRPTIRVERQNPFSSVNWPISPSAARVVAPAAVGSRYRLVFADEFDDDRVERINEEGKFSDKGAIAWRSRFRHPRKDIINQEKQIYVDRDFAGDQGARAAAVRSRIGGSVIAATSRSR